MSDSAIARTASTPGFPILHCLPKFAQAHIHAGGLDLIPGQGTKSHMLQLRIRMPQLKTRHDTVRTQHSQINKY